MEHEEQRSMKGNPPGRRSSLGRVAAAARELRREGAPYRVAGRPATVRLAALVAEACDIIERRRQPETTGFYYRKGQGCALDGKAYERILERFGRIRRLVNDEPLESLERELVELRDEYGRHAETFRENPSMGLGFRMNSLVARIDFLKYILELRREIGHVESIECYVAATLRKNFEDAGL